MAALRTLRIARRGHHISGAGSTRRQFDAVVSRKSRVLDRRGVCCGQNRPAFRELISYFTTQGATMTAEKDGPPEFWGVRRLWRLMDMMNFVLTRFLGALRFIDQEIAMCRFKRTQWGTLINPEFEEDKKRILNNLQFVTLVCKEMSLNSANDRLERISFLFRSGGATYTNIETEMVVLRQAIEDDLKYYRFYHYPKKVSEVPITFRTDWAETLAAFPSKGMEFEILSGADCYALGHPTAAIFHFMRVAEFGLRALARERKVRLGNNKPIEWGTWNDLISKIDGTARTIAQKWKAGPRKDAALDFYSGAVQNFNGFKDQYRNVVMHVRREYKDLEAEIAMRQVRDFMNKLSTKIGESTKGSLRWS
jgi:hypothetical protein